LTQGNPTNERVKIVIADSDRFGGWLLGFVPQPNLQNYNV